MLNGLCLFFLLVLLFPQAMMPGSTSRWVWYYIIVGLTVFVPSVLGVVYYSAHNAGSFDNKDDTSVWSAVAFAGSMSMYAVLLVAGVVGLGGLLTGQGSGNNLWISLLSLLLLPVAKSLLPVLVLLLGPGCIPTLSGKSFLEFCSA
jgi:hypothetical protein